MKKEYIAFLLALALIMPLCHAYDIGAFISVEHHFMHDGEKYEQPTFRIAYNDESYWVVPVLAGDSVQAYIPLKAESKDWQKSRPVNRELFEAADILRNYISAQRNASQSGGSGWIITAGNQRIADSLAGFLANETYELTTIDTTMDDRDASGRIATLNSMLVSMSLSSGDLAISMQDALSAEAKYRTAPDAKERDSIGGSFGDVFDTIDSLDETAREYLGELDKLKRDISVSGLDPDTKSSLLKLSEPPSEFNYIGQWAISGSGMRTVIDAIYAATSSRIDSLLDEFDGRVKLDLANAAIYREDEELKGLDNSFTSLKAAAAAMLNSDIRNLWAKQDALKELESNLSNAEKYYKRADYDLAAEYAGKAKKNVKTVYNGGKAEVTASPIFSQDFLFWGVVVLIALLVIAYVVQNREKLFGFGGNGGEEVEPDGGFGKGT